MIMFQEIMWAVISPKKKVLPYTLAYNRASCEKKFIGEDKEKWKKYWRDGWRIKKVEVIINEAKPVLSE